MDRTGQKAFLAAAVVGLGIVQVGYGLWRGDLTFAAFGGVYGLVGVLYYYGVSRADG